MQRWQGRRQGVDLGGHAHHTFAIDVPQIAANPLSFLEVGGRSWSHLELDTPVCKARRIFCFRFGHPKASLSSTPDRRLCP